MTREEAIEMVRKSWPISRNKDLRKALETLIPELAESEDERIRKALIELVGLVPDYMFGEIKPNKFIAYLEKQKEQKPISFNEPYNPDDYEVVMEGNATGLKLKEQKPAEWSEEDEHNLNSVINLVHNTSDGAWGSCIGDRIENWLKSLPERFNLQPKQEWSEEIKKYFDGWGEIGDGDSIITKDSDYVGLKDLPNIARHFAEWGAEHLKK
jgi:hypothetical protein